ncbi:glycosyltransferase [Marinifilum caeruleilacunae]|uniref:Glycosyltransferase n=1 Tax=Marinifilum caeruleilacunae TaxID=2499076 RepID=A0ABX1WS65_9BACT|nr:glycosyltransferase [Marinifilum caeruleilacunae]NOU58944.1 glycosyltransferase [Marinifilum caeruleilacunae]
MKAILFSLGSRGDIEPLFALGEILRSKNWEVIYVFPEQFRELVEGENTSFYPFTKEFLELLITSEKSKQLTSRSGSWLSRVKVLIGLAVKSIKINKEVLARQHEILEQEQADYVFFNQKCVYPILWELQNPGRAIFVHPFPCFLHKVKQHSIIGFSGGGNYGTILNSFTYRLQTVILSIAVYFSTKKYHKEIQGAKLNPVSIKRALLNRCKSVYMLSPSLFKQPEYWPQNANVVGYYERNKLKNWQADKKLIGFLKKYQKIVFITFGSISNSNPLEKTKAILSVLEKHKIPAIVNTSWGGLIQPESHADHIHFVNQIPYEWIMPMVYAVVHHGGSGTTHTALKYACANLIIPHFIDQFFWNKTIHQLEVGPKGNSIKKLNRKNFESKLLDLLQNPVYKKNAETIAKQMRNENDIEKLLELILREY